MPGDGNRLRNKYKSNGAMCKLQISVGEQEERNYSTSDLPDFKLLECEAVISYCISSLKLSI